MTDAGHLPLELAHCVSTSARLSVAPDTVHLWICSLDAGQSDIARCHSLLDSAESSRAACFRNDTDRMRFVAGRALVRSLLSAYAGIAPQALRFEYGHAGKPALTVTGAEASIEFNYSRSNGIGALAIGIHSLGVDIERCDPVFDYAAVARLCFSASELEALEQRSLNNRLECFFRYWVAKEAILKGHGSGLQVDLRQLSVALSKDESTGWIERCRADIMEGGWRVKFRDAHPGWRCAVASPGEQWEVVSAERRWLR